MCGLGLGVALCRSKRADRGDPVTVGELAALQARRDRGRLGADPHDQPLDGARRRGRIDPVESALRYREHCEHLFGQF